MRTEHKLIARLYKNTIKIGRATLYLFYVQVTGKGLVILGYSCDTTRILLHRLVFDMIHTPGNENISSLTYVDSVVVELVHAKESVAFSYNLNENSPSVISVFRKVRSLVIHM